MLKSGFRVFLSFFLLIVLTLGVVSPARAFDGRGGDAVVIGPDEVINDDLYVGSNTFSMDGTINGDLLAAAETLTINGTVDGDLMAAGKTIIINGKVTGAVRIAGAALLIGENASIGGDVIALGASLEAQKGSQIGKDVIYSGGQAMFAGQIGRDVKAFTGGLHLAGSIAGDVETEVGDPENAGPGPLVMIPDAGVPLPPVKPGLTLDPEAKIGGKLVYTSSKELNIPAQIVAGGIKYVEPVVDPATVIQPPTLAESIATGIFDALRNMISLALFGLLLGWLFPAFLKGATDRLRQSPFPAVGWGLVSWGAFFFAILVIIVATILGAIIFGVLTLGGVSGSIVWLGIFGLFALIFGFILANSFIAQIIVSLLGGKLLLERFRPEWADHKLWPLLLGVVIFSALAACPYIGWLVNLLAVLAGLGTLWLLGSNLFAQKQPES